MADFAAKLQELKEKMVAEFDSFKKSQNDFCRNDPKNLDTLLFKVTYEIERIKNDFSSGQHINDFNGIGQNKNTETVVKFQTLEMLQELKGKIMSEFDGFKHYKNNTTDIMDSQSIDTFLFKIQYQIDQMKSDILSGRNGSSSSEIRYVESSKADALIKLQTLANLITCHIIKLDKNL